MIYEPCTGSPGDRVDKTQTALCFIRSAGIGVVRLQTDYRKNLTRDLCVGERGYLIY